VRVRHAVGGSVEAQAFEGALPGAQADDHAVEPFALLGQLAVEGGKPAIALRQGDVRTP
jgi:hypothetical protein